MLTHRCRLMLRLLNGPRENEWSIYPHCRLMPGVIECFDDRISGASPLPDPESLNLARLFEPRMPFNAIRTSKLNQLRVRKGACPRSYVVQKYLCRFLDGQVALFRPISR